MDAKSDGGTVFLIDANYITMTKVTEAGEPVEANGERLKSQIVLWSVLHIWMASSV